VEAGPARADRLDSTPPARYERYVSPGRVSSAAFSKTVAKARKELKGAPPRSDRARAARAVDALVVSRAAFDEKLSAVIEANAKKDRVAAQEAARALAEIEAVTKPAAAAHARLVKRAKEEGKVPPPPLTDWAHVSRELAKGVKRVEPMFLDLGNALADTAVQSVYDHKAAERARFLLETAVEVSAIAGGLALSPIGGAGLSALLLARKIASDAIGRSKRRARAESELLEAIDLLETTDAILKAWLRVRWA
jgi:hypothetical protein